MRCWLRWTATALLVAAFSVLLVSPAAAHPTDEVLQQIYLRPAASGLTVQLDITPRVLVGPQFARTFDVDGDGVGSPEEIDAHVAAVRSAVTVRVDGVPVDLAVAGTSYPPVDLLAAAGGTITLTMTAPLATQAHQLAITDTYEPGQRSAVQMSVLVASDPVALGRIGHADGGRSMTVALNPTTPPAAPAAPVTAPAAPGSSMLDALRRPPALSAGVIPIPCPEALSVMLLAIGLNRTALGMVMIVAFSVGLAAVLVGLGLMLVTATPVVQRATGSRAAWVTTRLPLVSAAVVTVLGALMTVTGLSVLAG